MSVFIFNILRSGSVAFVGQKALRCFGKKDYADMIAGVGFASVGLELIMLTMYLANCFTNWINGIMDSPFIRFFTG